MKTIFSAYGSATLTIEKLYTNGTEDVSWVAGIDSVSGSNTGGAGGELNEGVNYATLSINNEPIGFMTTEIAYVTNSTVDITGYKRLAVDWEMISNGQYALIVDDTKNGGYLDYETRVVYGAGTGRKVSYITISSLSGSKYIRVNGYASTIAPDVDNSQIRIHRVWLEK